MRILGFELTRVKAQPPEGLQSVNDRGGWFPIINEPFTGAWQRNISLRSENVLASAAVFSCITLIASDVAKCRPQIVEQDHNRIWNEVTLEPFSRLLTKPNGFQNRIKFFENWVVSKLVHGNTYALKSRNAQRKVEELYILEPKRVKPLVAPDGAVYYEVQADNLAGLGETVVIPATEIIHDTAVALYHPLCGVSPLTACGLAARQGLDIQQQSAQFFKNNSQPGGLLIAPGRIDKPTADRLKVAWDQHFGGPNTGRVAILGDGLKYESLTMNATDAQLIEQLRWTGENVCATFHVPNYKIGAGPPPSLDNIEALERQYYAQALQTLFECIELLLDEGLELSREGVRPLGVEFDLDDLLRMDSKTLIESEARAVGAGIRTPNEARKRLNTGPVQGGDTPYLQQQNFSLAALDKRDKLDDPFSAPKVSKTITTRKDENGNLVADVIEHHGVPATGGVKASGSSDVESMESIARRVAKETAGSVNLEFDYDGERSLTIRQLCDGELVGKACFALPIPLDRGLWTEGHYDAGDGVTFQSSYWLAQRSTFAKPGTDDSLASQCKTRTRRPGRRW